MAWYLYGVGVVTAWLLVLALGKTGREVSFLTKLVVAFGWPVFIPSLAVGGFLLGIMETVNEKRENDTRSGSNQGD